MRSVISMRTLATALLALLALVAASAGCDEQGRNPATTAAPAVIMIVAGDWRDDRLVPLAAGSGTIVSADGAVLTTHHLLYDEERRRLHDRFTIMRVPAEGRAPARLDLAASAGPRTSARAPTPICTGRPAHGARAPALDLAVIRCDRDMAGRPFRAEAWPAIAIGRADTLAPGDPVWILGYPRSGHGDLEINTGPVTGWTGEHGGPGNDFLTAGAPVAPGASGGAVVDRTGALVGVATGYRVRTRISAVGAMPVGRIGLVRPVERAQHLLDMIIKSVIYNITRKMSPASLTTSL